MSNERRFTEREIAAIFEHAAQAQKSAREQMSGGEGLTLAELQEVGREAGISSEHVARAAAVVASPSPTPSTGPFGLPTRVSKTVELPRTLTEQEWDRIVVDLRETFRARGEVRRGGSLLQWTNGNLQALLEPGESGHRLRLRTLHEMARNGFTGGLVAASFFLVTILIGAVTGKAALDPDILLLAVMGTVSLLFAGFSAGRIRR